MKRSGLRWLVVGLIAIATVINYIDRNALAVMWPAIAEETGATKDDYPLLITCFMVFYAIRQSLFGALFVVLKAISLQVGAWCMRHSTMLISLTRRLLTHNLV